MKRYKSVLVYTDDNYHFNQNCYNTLNIFNTFNMIVSFKDTKIWNTYVTVNVHFEDVYYPHGGS